MLFPRTYRTQAVNGVLLPVDGETDAVIVLFANGTYASSPTYPADQPLPDIGTYSYNPATGSITMTNGPVTFSGVINEAILILNGGGSLYISTRFAIV